MNGHRWNVLRNARSQGDYPRHIHGIGRLPHAAKDHLINQGRIDSRASKQSLGRDTAQFVSREAGQVRADLAEGRANPIHNDEIMITHGR